MATYGGLGAPLSRIKIEETARSTLTVYSCNNLSKVGHICTFYIERPDFDLNIVLQINFQFTLKNGLNLSRSHVVLQMGGNWAQFKIASAVFHFFIFVFMAKFVLYPPEKLF